MLNQRQLSSEPNEAEASDGLGNRALEARHREGRGLIPTKARTSRREIDRKGRGRAQSEIEGSEERSGIAVRGEINGSSSVGEGEAERNEKRNGGLNTLEPRGESAGNQSIGRRGEEQSTKIAREPRLSKGRVRKLSGKHGAKRNRHKFVDGRCNRRWRPFYRERRKGGAHQRGA